MKPIYSSIAGTVISLAVNFSPLEIMANSSNANICYAQNISNQNYSNSNKTYNQPKREFAIPTSDKELNRNEIIYKDSNDFRFFDQNNPLCVYSAIPLTVLAIYLIRKNAEKIENQEKEDQENNN